MCIGMYSAGYVWPMFNRQGWLEFQQARVMLTMRHIWISLDELRQASRTTIREITIFTQSDTQHICMIDKICTPGPRNRE